MLAGRCTSKNPELDFNSQPASFRSSSQNCVQLGRLNRHCHHSLDLLSRSLRDEAVLVSEVETLPSVMASTRACPQEVYLQNLQLNAHANDHATKCLPHTTKGFPQSSPNPPRCSPSRIKGPAAHLKPNITSPKPQTHMPQSSNSSGRYKDQQHDLQTTPTHTHPIHHTCAPSPQ